MKKVIILGAGISGLSCSYHLNKSKVENKIYEKRDRWGGLCDNFTIDGFRFDLGAALTRGADLTPLDQPPLFEAMESDPELADIKLVGEPWDCGGLSRLADFPARRVGTWNGRFRDATASSGLAEVEPA